MTYEGFQSSCESAYQQGEAGRYQLRVAASGALQKSSNALEDVEPLWRPELTLWTRYVDQRGPYWRPLG